MSANDSILVIRLGAMGDIIHALPAVATLKRSFPHRKLRWLVARRWLPLLQGNPSIDELIPFERSGLGSLRSSWERLSGIRPGIAVDFQGLVQSALLGRITRPQAFFGFEGKVAREPAASIFYSHRVRVKGPHRVQRNVELVQATGARQVCWDSWLPRGAPEGELPCGDFVLASPFAGWKSKQWPLQQYADLAPLLKREGLELVVNVPSERAGEMLEFPQLKFHTSSLAGLIDATRRATAVIGVDSGPLHLAAALGKPGVALFGPTDPVQTGPFNCIMIVLRSPHVETSYNREDRIHSSMREISAEQVARALHRSLSAIAVPRQ